MYLDILMMVIISGATCSPCYRQCSEGESGTYTHLYIPTQSCSSGRPKSLSGRCPHIPQLLLLSRKKGCMLMTMEPSSRAVIGLETRNYSQKRVPWKSKGQIFFRARWKCVPKAGTETKISCTQVQCFSQMSCHETEHRSVLFQQAI